MKNLLIILSLILIGGCVNSIDNENKSQIASIIQNINVTIDGSSVLRSGDTFIIRPVIRNMNNDVDIDIKEIEFLNSENEIVNKFDINKRIKPIKEKTERLEKFKSSLILINKEEFEKLIEEIKNETFSKSFYLNIYDFDPSREIGKTITIPIHIKFSYDNKNFTINTSHSMLISEPLPKPP